MRDWISIPKSNGYESLHTTVATKEGRWVEIQIRTERMDAVAERGIAAHWRYKGVNAGSDGSEMWMKQLRELMEDKTRPLAQNFDAKPSSGEIFVFTPGGDLRKLPEGATVLDFAFDIHTSLGLTCSGGKVNNRPAAIRDVLHNGDIVEVLTQKNQKPKADWLGFVTTSKARTRIKASLREEHTKNARLGREELERKLKNWKLPPTVDEGVGILCKHFKLRTGTELYASIGTEKIDLMQIKELPGPSVGRSGGRAPGRSRRPSSPKNDAKPKKFRPRAAATHSSSTKRSDSSTTNWPNAAIRSTATKSSASSP